MEKVVRMLYETKFILALIITLALETLGLVLLLKIIFKFKKYSLKKLIIIGIVASALTLPYLWFVFVAYLPRLYCVIFGEIFVILVESVIYMQFLDLKWYRAFYVSFILNILSILAGLLFF